MIEGEVIQHYRQIASGGAHTAITCCRIDMPTHLQTSLSEPPLGRQRALERFRRRAQLGERGIDARLQGLDLILQHRRRVEALVHLVVQVRQSFSLCLIVFGFHSLVNCKDWTTCTGPFLSEFAARRRRRVSERWLDERLHASGDKTAVDSVSSMTDATLWTVEKNGHKATAATRTIAGAGVVLAHGRVDHELGEALRVCGLSAFRARAVTDGAAVPEQTVE